MKEAASQKVWRRNRPERAGFAGLIGCLDGTGSKGGGDPGLGLGSRGVASRRISARSGAVLYVFRFRFRRLISIDFGKERLGLMVVYPETTLEPLNCSWLAVYTLGSKEGREDCKMRLNKESGEWFDPLQHRACAPASAWPAFRGVSSLAAEENAIL